VKKLQNTRLIEKTQNVCTQETREETYTDKKGNTKTRNKTVKNCTPQTNLVETPQTSHTYTTNELNQYTNIENKNNKGETKTQIDFLYDNNGNLTEDESFTYTYDYKNRLIEMKSKTLKSDGITPKTLITYTYDLQDRIISKTLNSNNQITYLYAGKEILLETTKNKNGTILETRENIFSNKIDDIIATNITTYKTEKQQETYTDKKGNTKTRTINVRVPTTQRYFYHKNHL
jgi:YD repeat-containing protein